jgi:hypothetical protein
VYDVVVNNLGGDGTDQVHFRWTSEANVMLPPEVIIILRVINPLTTSCLADNQPLKTGEDRSIPIPLISS